MLRFLFQSCGLSGYDLNDDEQRLVLCIACESPDSDDVSASPTSPEAPGVWASVVSGFTSTFFTETLKGGRRKEVFKMKKVEDLILELSENHCMKKPINRQLFQCFPWRCWYSIAAGRFESRGLAFLGYWRTPHADGQLAESTQTKSRSALLDRQDTFWIVLFMELVEKKIAGLGLRTNF